MNARLRRYLVEPLLALLSRGTTPRQLALCVALGIVIGNIPILGVSTLLSAALALLLRLNLPAIQLVQGLMAPTQLVLIIPQVRLGEWLLRSPPEPLSIESSLRLLDQGVLHAVNVLWNAIIHAGVAFLLVGPLAAMVFYLVLVPVFERAARRLSPRAPSQTQVPRSDG